MTTLTGLYLDAEDMTDHWWWRPGWKVGTRSYAWHLTVEDQPALQALVAGYQRALEPLGTFTLIPPAWLHITCQGVGHVHEVSDGDRDEMVEAVAERLSYLALPEMTFHRPVLHSEAVVVPPVPAEPLIAVRDAIRRGIADAWGADRVTEKPSYRPHVSAAYSTAVQYPAEVRSALDAVESDPVVVTLPRVSLIVMHRDSRMYEWETATTVPSGSPD